MKIHHWIMCVVIFLIAYGIGVKFPAPGNKALALVGMGK